jgi:glycosyltransferase involved in cell wall biosynthesis
LQGIRKRLAGLKADAPRIAVERFGVPPAWTGYRWWQRETLREHAERTGAALQVIHEERTHEAPLPSNVAARESLIADRGWWGYSFRDVPERRCGETLLGTLDDARVAHFHQPPGHIFEGDHFVGVMTRDQRSLELREITLRDAHAQRLRSGGVEQHFERATWVAERVWHNYSHWLSAHLPKFVLLKRLGLLDDVLLPSALPRAHADSLRCLGLDPESFRTFDPGAVQRIREMNILSTDRFRPELVRSVRDALAPPGAVEPWRRVYITRARAGRRALLNETRILDAMRRFNFEIVAMETLSFRQQLELMAETRLLVAPHGAGLTNMIFCPPGTHVVEIANLDFPNPNFYALASALGPDYSLVPGHSTGDGHPIFRDIIADADALDAILPRLADRALRTAAPRTRTDNAHDNADNTHDDTRRAGLVSVIVPCYNKAPFIAEAIDSVLAQQDVELEVIVVDDASSDGSWDVIRRFEDRVHAHRMPHNSGSTATRKFGAARARGEFIMFLDGDDRLEPGTLRALRDAIGDRTGHVAAAPWRKLHLEDGRWVPREPGKPMRPPHDDPVLAWLGNWYIPPCAILWPRGLYDATGGWGEPGPWDDRELMLRALLRGARLAHADRGGALYRIFDDGESLSSLPTHEATRARIQALDDVAGLARQSGLFDRYRKALGAEYFNVAHAYARPYPDLLLDCYARVDLCLGRRPLSGSPLNRVLWRVMGLERKERAARWIRRVRA